MNDELERAYNEGYNAAKLKYCRNTKELCDRIVKAENENLQLKQTVKEFEDSYDLVSREAEEKRNQLQSEIENLNIDLDFAKMKMEELKDRHLEEKQRWHQDITGYDRKVNSLERDIENYVTKLAEMRSENDHLRAQVSMMKLVVTIGDYNARQQE